MAKFTTNIGQGEWLAVIGSNSFEPKTFKMGDAIIIPKGFELTIFQNDMPIHTVKAQENAHRFNINTSNIPEMRTKGLIFKKADLVLLIVNTHPNIFYNVLKAEPVNLKIGDDYASTHNIKKGSTAKAYYALYQEVCYNTFNPREIYKFWKSSKMKAVNGVFFKPASYMKVFTTKFIEEHMFNEYAMIMDAKNKIYDCHGPCAQRFPSVEKQMLDRLLKALYNAFDGLGFGVQIKVGATSDCPYGRK
ncbi:MAG TPA: hypothetical protein DEF61_04770 [Firmicutes bacterium]|nr:hypothetical protein [Bacillota bacterium]HBX25541.1 hypothetical protein [Bacillota bacterium]